MDNEVLQHLPPAFQFFIEAEAQKRAEKRFQEIIKGKATPVPGEQRDNENIHTNNGGSFNNELSYK